MKGLPWCSSNRAAAHLWCVLWPYAASNLIFCLAGKAEQKKEIVSENKFIGMQDLQKKQLRKFLFKDTVQRDGSGRNYIHSKGLY
jgi:hypothetical protein